MLKNRKKYFPNFNNYLFIKIKGVENFVAQNKLKFYLLAFLLILFYLISFVPYLNLFFPPLFTFSLFIIFCAFLFRLSGKIFLVLALILFVFMLVLTLLHNEPKAELIGNVTYMILALATFLFIKEVWKK